MSVGSDINPISIDPVVNKKPKNNDNPFTSQNDKDEDVTEEVVTETEEEVEATVEEDDPEKEKAETEGKGSFFDQFD